MNLLLPIPTQDPGPDWAYNLNISLSTIDSHDHSTGKGAPISTASLNINADLSFNSNDAIQLRSVRLAPQTSLISQAPDVGCLYESGVDLYYNDGSGNQIRITQSGGIAGSPGSISNLSSPASASYVAANQTFVWQSGVTIPANLDAASVILRNLSAGSFGLTLNPPSSMTSNSSITLPSIPLTASFLTMDTSGNVGTVSKTAGIVGSNLAINTITQSNMAPNSVGTSQLIVFNVTENCLALGAVTNTKLGPNAVTGDKIASATMLDSNFTSNSIGGDKLQNSTVGSTKIATNAITPAKLSAFNYTYTANSGAFSTTSVSLVPVTNLTANITVSGTRPVMIICVGDPSAGPSYVYNDTSVSYSLSLFKGSSPVTLVHNLLTGSLPPSAFSYIDYTTIGSAGAKVYSVYVSAENGGRTYVNYFRLFAYEM